MDIAIMVEGQMGLNWRRWQRLARAVEDFGFAGLYRSDHFTNPNPPDSDSLELWTSLTWLASHTQRIQFGPLVAPVSFRDPRMMARIAAAIDDLSGGRLILGMGAGWQEREHRNYGYDLLDVQGRLARLREALEVVTRLLRSDSPVEFEGAYYQLHDAILLPRPQRPGGPPILIGGGKAILPLAAEHADEWNAVFQPPALFRQSNALLERRLAERGRPTATVRRSMMTGLVFGDDTSRLQQKLDARRANASDLRARGLVVGTPTEVVEQLQGLADTGLHRVMLQWLDLDDLDGLRTLAEAVLPHFPSA